MRWHEYHSPEGQIDLWRACSIPYELMWGVAAYSACWVRCDTKRSVVLATGSHEGIKVWINRELVLDKDVQREAEPDSEQTRIELSAGWNEVLVKIDTERGEWSFFLELRDPATGGALQGVEYRLKPPEKKR
jgi:hypothetical protein